jgi:hypothetical protein
MGLREGWTVKSTIMLPLPWERAKVTLFTTGCVGYTRGKKAIWENDVDIVERDVKPFSLFPNSMSGCCTDYDSPVRWNMTCKCISQRFARICRYHYHYNLKFELAGSIDIVNQSKLNQEIYLYMKHTANKIVRVHFQGWKRLFTEP